LQISELHRDKTRSRYNVVETHKECVNPTQTSTNHRKTTTLGDGVISNGTYTAS